ncbi:hypothetical protein [Hyphomonas sp.]|uniref:hypothetical protein n=1 Tax=Hyphomonas sp. TaxID=87 RepID=UPI00391C2581
MRDHFFFPLAVFGVGLLVFLAILPGFGRLPDGAMAGDGVNYDRIVIEGPNLNRIVAGGNAETRLIRDGQKYLLFIEVEEGALSDAPELGPHFRLAADIELQFSGRRIRVTVRARPAEIRGAEQIMVNYSAGRIGESGWQVLGLQPGFSDVSFDYLVPPIQGDQGLDYLAIRPVVPDKSRAIIIEQVVLERLP